MQSLDNIYIKMSPAMDVSALAHLHQPMIGTMESNYPLQARPDKSDREIGRDLAHDLNNALTIIHGYTEQLLFNRDLAADERSQLQIVLEHTQRAENLIRNAARSKKSAA